MDHSDVVLKEALRVGKEVIVGFPNFAHYSSRSVRADGFVPYLKIGARTTFLTLIDRQIKIS